MHTKSNIINQDLKQLLSIYDDFININSYEYIDDLLCVFVSRTCTPHPCPRCGNYTSSIHDYRTRTVKHGVFNHFKCILVYSQRRYRCSCGKRFKEYNSFVESYNKISSNTKKSVTKISELKISFTDYAKLLNISVTTLIRIFNKHCKQTRLPLPKVLSIDEFKGNSGGNKYLTSLCDQDNGTIIDILPSRHKEHLFNYFATFSKVELAKVKVFTMDMWPTYKDVCEKFFPNATLVIDTFHYVRHIYWAANNTRIRIMKKYKESSKEYKLLKRFWRLFVSKPWIISDKLIFNKYTKKWTSKSHILQNIINTHPELTKAYELLSSFYTIVHTSSYPNVYKDLTNWIINAKTSLIGEFRDAAQTIENWLPEITNSFMINPVTGTKYSNAFIEGVNNYIKVIKRLSFGIPTFSTFRNKVMFQKNNSRRIITA